VRFTVARKDAEAALKIVERQLGARLTGGESTIQPLPGGETSDFQRFADSLQWQLRECLPAARCESLARNYGVRAQHVLELAQTNPALRGCVPGASVTLAEVVFAIREEMAQRMTDIVFRRTELGAAGHPGPSVLDPLQEFLSRQCQWTKKRAAEERAATESCFKRYLARVSNVAVAARSA
jgi:glycerol-3-phosphate dehydrogenase